MNFEDERWVKVFIRDTTNWKLLNWQARCVLSLLFRKVDCAGKIDVGAHPVRAISAMVELPKEVVEAGLPALLAHDEGEEPTAVLDGRDLVLVKFAEAQNSNASAKARQREWRARRKVGVDVTSDDSNVALRDVDATLLPVDVALRDVDAARRDVTRRNDQRRGEEREREDIHLAALGPPSSDDSGNASKVGRGETRGHRIPVNWKPATKELAYAKSLGLDAGQCELEFRNYWESIPGAKGRKLDWDKTFYNRITEVAGRIAIRANGRPALTAPIKSPAHRLLNGPPAEPADGQVPMYLNGGKGH